MDERVAQNMMRRVAYGDCLRRTTRRYANREALIDGERRMTYSELNEAANRFGSALLKRGFAQGTKIAFVSLNALEYFIAFYGAAKAGMTFVPVNPLYKPEELTFAVNHADCEVFIFDGMLYPLIKDAVSRFERVRHFIAFRTPSAAFQDFNAFLQEGDPDEVEVYIDQEDVLLLLYTGGTTSFPRAAQLTHLNLFVAVHSILVDIPFNKHDKSILAMPLFHVGALTVSQLLLLVGGSVVLMAMVDMGKMLELIDREKVTHMLLLSPLYRMFLTHPDFSKYDLSSLRLATYFAAVMPEDLLHELMEKICPNLCLNFGQTEMSPSTTTFKPEDQLRKMKSLGNSAMNVEITVMDDHGKILPCGEIGEIVYRSPQTMKGYYKADEENRKAFEYGWFHSGDIGYVDEENFVYFVDRKKDMIKTGGENVASLEVEKAIYLDPRVQEVHVVGLPHERWAEAITAFVLPKPGETITEDEVIALCKEKMVGFKVPKKVMFVPDLPRSPVGKVLKYKLKDAYRDLYKGGK